MPGLAMEETRGAHESSLQGASVVMSPQLFRSRGGPVGSAHPAGPSTTSSGDEPGERRADEILRVEDLSIWFATDAGEVQAVKDVSFTIRAGEAVGMVGESGSGKSITGLAIMRLLETPPARVEGRVLFQGRDLLDLPEAEMQSLRGSAISMVFQDPMTALDPVFTVGRQISETIRAHRGLDKKAAREAAIEMLAAVGIPLPAQRYGEYPHQLSGGMRQRVMIAMALSCEPALIIADEPTTAVDVTIQAQIIALLRRLSDEHNTAVLLITHDLGVVAEFCSRVLTLYAGQVVETASADDLLASPQHPYTSGLLQAIPRVTSRGKPLLSIRGRVPAPADMPQGCRFHPRCDHVLDPCLEPQALLPAGEGRAARCWRHDQLDLPGALS
jgi:peptide/nickel transport system ATP-binding protein